LSAIPFSKAVQTAATGAVFAQHTGWRRKIC